MKLTKATLKTLRSAIDEALVETGEKFNIEGFHELLYREVDYSYFLYNYQNFIYFVKMKLVWDRLTMDHEYS